MTPNDYPLVLTAKQAAKLLQFEVHKIYELVREKKIPAWKVGRAIRFNRDELLKVTAGLDGVPIGDEAGQKIGKTKARSF